LAVEGFAMDEKVSLTGPRTWMDSLGTTVSIACAIQCTFFPLLISVLPLVGLGFLAGDGVEQGFIITSVILLSVASVGDFDTIGVSISFCFLFPA
jgi:hypothetical protein